MPISLYLLFFWGKVLHSERDTKKIQNEDRSLNYIEKTKEDLTTFVQMVNT